MTNHSELMYSCTNAIFRYLKDFDLDRLISSLHESENYLIEKYIENDSYDSDMNMWFKFGTHDTLVTTISTIKNMLSLPIDHPNHKLMLDNFRLVVGINPEDEIKIYFS